MPQIPQDRSSVLMMNNAKYVEYVLNFCTREIANDGNDITTEFLLGDHDEEKSAGITARMSGILAGREEIDFWNASSGEKLSISWKYADGDAFHEHENICDLRGSAKTILQWERMMLSILSRMSGIATETKKIADVLPPGVFVAATRKTLWGMLDKKAVAVGGGLSHRLGLSDAILVKENHLALFPEGIEKVAHLIANAKTFEKNNFGSFWEIEVETASDLFSLLKVLQKQSPEWPGVLLLDNFSAKEIRNIFSEISKAKYHQKNIFFEASGGIHAENFMEYAHSGVDVISCGFLTHSAGSIDLSLRILP
ncbi:hypothetical protein HZA38_00445 [Candidatus Peregrinibacteria bacterium]|nr:hypothetical protein [Candidatus Peregrinibacteria bacterium]